MLNLRHYLIEGPVIEPYPKGDWHLTWHGLLEKTEALSQKGRLEISRIVEDTRSRENLPESEFERDCLLSVLQSLDRKKIVVWELGAGFGRICLSVEGVIRNSLVDTPIKEVLYLAVEGEPSHFNWCKETFLKNGLNSEILLGVVADSVGRCRFDCHGDPSSRYGQTTSSLISRNKIPGIGRIYNFLTRGSGRLEIIKDYWRLLRGGTVLVDQYSLDSLLTKSKFSWIDLIHMDIQGMEFKACLGGRETLDRLSYLMIGTHSSEVHSSLKELLYTRFNQLVDIYPHSIGQVEGFPPIECEDGIQLWERK